MVVHIDSELVQPPIMHAAVSSSDTAVFGSTASKVWDRWDSSRASKEESDTGHLDMDTFRQVLREELQQLQAGLLGALGEAMAQQPRAAAAPSFGCAPLVAAAPMAGHAPPVGWSPSPVAPSAPQQVRQSNSHEMPSPGEEGLESGHVRFLSPPPPVARRRTGRFSTWHGPRTSSGLSPERHLFRGRGQVSPGGWPHHRASGSVLSEAWRCAGVDRRASDLENPMSPFDRSDCRAFRRYDTTDRFDKSREDAEKWRKVVKGNLTRRLRSMRSGSLQHRFSMLVGGHSRSKWLSEDTVGPLEALVESQAFQFAVFPIIVLNAIFIGYQTDQLLKNSLVVPPVPTPRWFQAGNLMFMGIFIVEILLRMAGLRMKFFLGAYWRWNVFDLCLVLYSIVDEIFNEVFEEFVYIRILRVFRMVRVFRVIRVMSAFHELRLMVCSILQSFGSLCWAMVLLTLIMYLFTIIFMHACTHYLSAGNAAPANMVHFYGSVADTMFTLLLAISAGEDWRILVEPLEEVSMAYRWIFAGYVVFMLIGVLNVLTSVFVERARELNRLDRDLKIQSELAQHSATVTDLKGIFKEIINHESNDNLDMGEISWENFHDYLQKEEVQAYMATQQLDCSDARELFDLLDVNGSESVTMEDFVMGCLKLKGQAKSVEIATLLRETRENQRTTQRLKAMIRGLDDAVLQLRQDLLKQPCRPGPAPGPSPPAFARVPTLLSSASQQAGNGPTLSCLRPRNALVTKSQGSRQSIPSIDAHAESPAGGFTHL